MPLVAPKMTGHTKSFAPAASAGLQMPEILGEIERKFPRSRMTLYAQSFWSGERVLGAAGDATGAWTVFARWARSTPRPGLSRFSARTAAAAGFGFARRPALGLRRGARRHHRLSTIG